MSTKLTLSMAEIDLPSSLPRRSRSSRLCRRALAAGFGFSIGAAFLLLIGFIASLDVFMPSNGIYRNVSHTNMGILKALFTTALNNIAARYGGTTNQSEASGTNASEEQQGHRALVNDTSPLLIWNRSLSFHAELRHQHHIPVEDYLLAHPPDAVTANGTSLETTVPASVASARGSIQQQSRSDMDKANTAENIGQSVNHTNSVMRRFVESVGGPLEN